MILMYYSRFDYNVSVTYSPDDISKVKELWEIQIYCRKQSINNGVIVDKNTIDEFIADILPSMNLEKLIENSPTMENTARWIYEQIIYCYKVVIINNGTGSIVTYEEDKV